MVTIPRSTILMCVVVVVVPFGLTIREIVGRECKATVVVQTIPMIALPEAQDQPVATPPTPAPEEAEAESARRAKLVGLIAQLHGPRSATLGPLFAGVRIGAPVGAYVPDATRRSLAALADAGLTVELEASPIRLDAVNVSIANLDCGTVSESLVQAWGTSDDLIWLDRAAHIRAHLDLDACALRFDRYLEASAWVGGNDAVVSLGLVGTSVDAQTTRLGALATLDGDALTWSGPGVGLGHIQTSLTANVSDGKITQLVATTDADALTRGAILDRLVKFLGTPAASYSGDIVWDTTATHPRVVLTTETDFTLTIGD
jgi:hypothetical protein